MNNSQVATVVKNPPASAGDLRDLGLISGSWRYPGGEHGNPFQYSCLENPLDRGAWWATVHGVSKSKTGLKQLSTHTCTIVFEQVNYKIFFKELFQITFDLSKTRKPYAPVNRKNYLISSAITSKPSLY